MHFSSLAQKSRRLITYLSMRNAEVTKKDKVLSFEDLLSIFLDGNVGGH